MISLRDRLLAKAVINPETGCWLWTASCDYKGYGRFWGSAQQPYLKAHRISYELANGPIADGLTIDHLCRVRHCINPAHLESVPMGVNVLRGTSFAAVNAAKTSCPAGHEYTPENTYADSKGYRYCRACRRGREMARYYNRKAAV